MSLENPRAGQGAVVLDIGGDVGALVLTLPADLDGAEVEICPIGLRGSAPDDGGTWWVGEWRAHTHSDHPLDAHPGAAAWPHVGVVPRATPEGMLHAAVFPALRAGGYELWLRQDHRAVMTAAVAAAQVTTVAWRPGSASSVRYRHQAE